MMQLDFFFSSRRRHTRYIGDWSSDVCSSDLAELHHLELAAHHGGHHAAARARLDRALGQLLLDVRDLLRRLLPLPEGPAQVEALPHRPLPAPTPPAPPPAAEILDRGLHHRTASRPFGPP